MSAAKINPGIYNIPSGTAFARALAAQLINETTGQPEALTAYRIILPTRRAVRVLHEAFAAETGNQPLLLPQMHSLGDIDEEDISLAFAGAEAPPEWHEIRPALPPLKRQILLAKTIAARSDYEKKFDQALLLAAALGRLIDHIHTEGLDMKKLPTLVREEELAIHWQVTLKFMEILSEYWPQVLAENGFINAANRRNLLLRSLAGFWRKSPPSTPVIAAGTTGSIPATAELLQVIADLPQGRVVLPGLDTAMDEQSWHALDETHPQYGLKQLLETLGIDRREVSVWPKAATENRERLWLASELMRPAATTNVWAENLTAEAQKIKKALKNIHILACDNEREEALVIAALLRQSLEEPGRTAAVITPRRSLARRIAAFCRRWEIDVDDSAGQPLHQTTIGTFLLLGAEAAAANFSPVALLSLLKHPYCKAENIENLDLALRGPRPQPGLEGIKARDTAGILKVIDPSLNRFTRGADPHKLFKFNEILEAHLETSEALAGGPDLLWQGNDGEHAAAFFADLSEEAGFLPDITIQSYCDILTTLMKTITVRPPYGTHPRLQILGQLEARLIDADLVIMAGLNEKSWPPAPAIDPWMSRPMQKDFGLPSPERSIGLAAHDFVQGFCAPATIITRSRRVDGAPSMPARWLQRLDAVLEAAAISPAAITSSPALSWVTSLDESAAFAPGKRPAPHPPQKARPRKLSVTRIEKWRQDPYSIYAEYILGLRKLDALEKPPEAAEKGILLHAVMKRFTDKIPGAMPENAQGILTKIAAEELAKRHEDPAAWSFWQRRFEKAAGWLVQHEQEWRKTARPLGTEIRGEIKFRAPGGDFTLSATADRIDSVPGGGAVIDYKSGGNFSAADIRNSKKPQLILEALILEQAGFKDIGRAVPPVSLQYWKLTGGLKPSDKPVTVETGLKELMEEAEKGLKALVAVFDNDQTPYYSVPAPEYAPRFNDYKHLARISEWAALGDDESGSEAA